MRCVHWVHRHWGADSGVELDLCRPIVSTAHCFPRPQRRGTGRCHLLPPVPCLLHCGRLLCRQAAAGAVHGPPDCGAGADGALSSGLAWRQLAGCGQWAAGACGCCCSGLAFPSCAWPWALTLVVAVLGAGGAGAGVPHHLHLRRQLPGPHGCVGDGNGRMKQGGVARAAVRLACRPRCRPGPRRQPGPPHAPASLHLYPVSLPASQTVTPHAHPPHTSPLL